MHKRIETSEFSWRFSSFGWAALLGVNMKQTSETDTGKQARQWRVRGSARGGVECLQETVMQGSGRHTHEAGGFNLSSRPASGKLPKEERYEKSPSN